MSVSSSAKCKPHSRVVCLCGRVNDIFECVSVVLLTDVQILPCSADILYLYSCILVYEQCFVVTVVIV